MVTYAAIKQAIEDGDEELRDKLIDECGLDADECNMMAALLRIDMEECRDRLAVLNAEADQLDAELRNTS